MYVLKVFEFTAESVLKFAYYFSYTICSRKYMYFILVFYKSLLLIQRRPKQSKSSQDHRAPLIIMHYMHITRKYNFVHSYS